MNATETVIATLEGPKGVAQVVEIIAAGGTKTEYETRFRTSQETQKWVFPSMGEAYIEAKMRSGVKE